MVMKTSLRGYVTSSIMESLVLSMTLEFMIGLSFHKNKMSIKVRIGLNTKIVNHSNDEMIRETINSDVDHAKYRAWHKQSIFNSDDYVETLAELYYCLAGAKYIKELVLAQYKTPPTLNPVSGSIADFRHLEGIYHIELDNNFECHACVIDFRKEDITIYTSYGGTVGFNITHHNKQKWVDALLAFDVADAETQFFDYFKLWGIKTNLEFIRTGYIPAIQQLGPVRIMSLKYTKLA